VTGSRKQDALADGRDDGDGAAVRRHAAPGGLPIRGCAETGIMAPLIRDGRVETVCGVPVKQNIEKKLKNLLVKQKGFK